MDDRRRAVQAGRRAPLPGASQPAQERSGQHRRRGQARGQNPGGGRLDRARPRGRRLSGPRSREEAPDEELLPAVHHIDAAAGRIQPPALSPSQHDAHRAAALRGHRARRRGVHRFDHIYAYRLHAHLRRGRGEGENEKHGSKYVGAARVAKASPGAQDAHEAIRPTDVSRTPESVRNHLSADQFKLYDLIWRRFVASRMAPAVYDQTQAEIEGADYIFRATGSVLAFDGFYKVWERDENGETELPELVDGEDLTYHGIKPEQHFSQPPPRYSEATLIKELEQRGIGRPSTYAPIVETIKDHGYVEIKERRLHPTRIGEAVNAIMVDHFKVIS
ncbi:MAG: hypothetical protein E6J40_15320, partial [Chloroflexi bacterium]